MSEHDEQSHRRHDDEAERAWQEWSAPEVDQVIRAFADRRPWSTLVGGGDYRWPEDRAEVFETTRAARDEETGPEELILMVRLDGPIQAGDALDAVDRVAQVWRDLGRWTPITDAVGSREGRTASARWDAGAAEFSIALVDGESYPELKLYRDLRAASA